MNKQRRKNISEVVDKLTECLERLGELRDEERDYVDSIPENMRDGERAQAADDCASVMDDSYMELEQVITQLSEVTAS